MKILETHEDQRTYFEDLRTGEAFVVMDDNKVNRYYLKTADMIGTGYNSVDIEKGTYQLFNRSEVVVPLPTAKFTVN